MKVYIYVMCIHHQGPHSPTDVWQYDTLCLKSLIINKGSFIRNFWCVQLWWCLQLKAALMCLFIYLCFCGGPEGAILNWYLFSPKFDSFPGISYTASNICQRSLSSHYVQFLLLLMFKTVYIAHEWEPCADVSFSYGLCVRTRVPFCKLS